MQRRAAGDHTAERHGHKRAVGNRDAQCREHKEVLKGQSRYLQELERRDGDLQLHWRPRRHDAGSELEHHVLVLGEDDERAERRARDVGGGDGRERAVEEEVDDAGARRECGRNQGFCTMITNIMDG